MDTSYLIREIRRTYQEYIEETVRLQKAAKGTDGLLGFGKGPGSSPVHDRFPEQLEQQLEALYANAPSASEVREVLEFMYDVPLRNKDNQLAFWMLQAVHSLTEKLIGLLSREDAAVLWAMYKEAYPRSARMPAQVKIAARLRAQAGEEEKKRSLLDILRRRD